MSLRVSTGNFGDRHGKAVIDGKTEAGALRIRGRSAKRKATPQLQKKFLGAPFIG